MKAVRLTPGGLRCVPVGLGKPRGFLIAVQKSADGVLVTGKFSA